MLRVEKSLGLIGTFFIIKEYIWNLDFMVLIMVQHEHLEVYYPAGSILGIYYLFNFYDAGLSLLLV